jgi:elongation factor G
MSAESRLALTGTRNVGILAHIDAGKTTLTERILFSTGRIRKLGDVDEGTTETDWMDIERERGITITAAATYCPWRDCRINIIDTPGHVDFTAEVERSLRVLDGAVVVVCAVAGVQSQTETIWRQCDKRRVPRLVFVNKLDRKGAGFDRIVKDLASSFRPCPLPVQLPVGAEAGFRGIIDLLAMRAFLWKTEDMDEAVESEPIPEALREDAERARAELVELLADLDGVILERFVSGARPDVAELKAALRRSTLAGLAYPVFCGSALRNRAVWLLLDGIVDYLPSPADLEPEAGEDPTTGEDDSRPADAEAPFSALAFKLMTDPFFGKLVFLRIYSGILRPGDVVLDSSSGVKERALKLFRMHANREEAIPEGRAGDIVAAAGLRSCLTGHSLCAVERPIVFESIGFAEPVASIMIEPRTRSDIERLREGLDSLLEEDPSLRSRLNEETGLITISGMGELHLDVTVERLTREFGARARVGKPEVSYRETIGRVAEGGASFDRVVNGRRQFGALRLRIEPLERGAGIEFENAADPRVSAPFAPAVERGLRSAMGIGVLAGYPVTDIRGTLIDIEFDERDSAEIAYEIAASLALRNTLSDAKPIILEPLMRLEIELPEEVLGDVVSCVTGRSGRIETIEDTQDGKVVSAFAPLRRLFGFSDELRSATKGRASLTLRFFRFEPAPKSLQDEMAEKSR